MSKANGFNARPAISRMVLPDGWKDVFPSGELDLKVLQERLTVLCGDPSQTTLNDLQQVREIIEALMFNYISYDPDTNAYVADSLPDLPSIEAMEHALGTALDELGLGWHGTIYALPDSDDTINWEDIEAELEAFIGGGETLVGSLVGAMPDIVAGVLKAADEIEEKKAESDVTLGDIAERMTRLALFSVGLLEMA